MAGRRVSAWGRRLREVASHLTSSAREIFEPAEPVAFAPPDPTPQREGGPSSDHAPSARRAGGKAGRLPRERRGRD